MTPSIALHAPATVDGSMQRIAFALDEFARLERNKYALADWLNGAYRAALVLPHPGPFCLGMTTSVDLAIREVQTQLRDAREAACCDGGRFLSTLPSRVHTVRVYDDGGERGFAPIDLPGATLAARVLSLLLAHYLTRPEDFAAQRRSPKDGESLPHRLLEERNGVAEGDLVVRALP